MIEKLINKGMALFISVYQDEPYITIAVLLTILIFIVCCIRLFKYLIVIFFAFITVIVLAICINSYMETRSLEYQLAQQMISEKCTDTIDLELYLGYENITFVNGQQYRYGQEPANSIARNYVCHSSKRTYSVDFLLEQYKDRLTFKDHVDALIEDLDLLTNALNSKKKNEQTEEDNTSK
ncbi:hypothetical protein [Acinetobacter sp. YH12153]|uniref:hypothetical protein n=1 Tax=Acinetobacter sp. YH12153 TaxID=2601133 RepID=UPI0015D3E21A|nr:hypothetical protein [Acinetobacter sp. YH12153]